MPKLKKTKEWALIRPEGETEFLTNHEELRWMQEQVGGYLELVHVRWNGRIRKAYVNEEAKIKGNFPINRRASSFYGHDVILGNMLIEIGETHV